MTTSRTYKAVFTCPKYQERVFWYVSSPHKARKMMHAHICGHKRRLKQYKDMKEGVDFFLDIVPLFDDLPDQGVPETGVFYPPD